MHKLYPDDYYRHYYFTKKLCNGIDVVAEMEKCNKTAAADLLMRADLSSYMGEKVSEYYKAEREAKKNNQKLKLTRFMIVLRRLCREQGIDISKLI